MREDTKLRIDQYVENGMALCGFLNAVFCNNLFDAVALADSGNRQDLPEIVSYIYNQCPSGCWGSPENVYEWKKQKREERRALCTAL